MTGAFAGPAPDLAGFLTGFEALDLAGQRLAIAEEVVAHGGTWEPAADEDGIVAISLHGAVVMGSHLDDAIRRWRLEARNVVQGYPKVSHHPARCAAQLEWAEHAIRQSYRLTDATLRSACQIILAHSREATMRDVARRLCPAMEPA
jgi:hypothetical protein